MRGLNVGDGTVAFDGECGVNSLDAVGPLGMTGNPSAQCIVATREPGQSVGYDEQNAVDGAVGDEAVAGEDALDECVAAEEEIAILLAN